MAQRAIEPDIERRLRELLKAEQGVSSTAGAVHAAIRRAIIEGDLPPGSRLTEERLAALFGVSRTPIREALAHLAESNLVRRDDRGTIRVQALTPDKLLEVYAVRFALEGLAARLAAQFSTPAAVVRLTELNRACAEAAKAANFVEMAERNLSFHAAIADAARNEMLSDFMTRAHAWVRLIPTTTLSHPGRAEKAVAQHEAIIDAIANRAPEEAEELAREHMREAEAIRITMMADG
jgi:DNA-binding GntR family transcriptional regulator